MANGMLQTSWENFTLLNGAMLFNTTLAWSPAGLAGGVLQGMLATPLGMLMCSGNTGGQTSTELISGVPLSPTSTLMLGLHSWHVLGKRGGVKGALEWAHQELDGDELVSASAVTLACTKPLVQADGSALAEPEQTTTFSVVHKTSVKNALVASLEWAPKTDGVMTLGGTRQLTDRTRLRGKWNTNGVLGLALEVAGEKSSMQLTTEWNTNSGSPSFGTTINLSL